MDSVRGSVSGSNVATFGTSLGELANTPTRSALDRPKRASCTPLKKYSAVAILSDIHGFGYSGDRRRVVCSPDSKSATQVLPSRSRSARPREFADDLGNLPFNGIAIPTAVGASLCDRSGPFQDQRRAT